MKRFRTDVTGRGSPGDMWTRRGAMAAVAGLAACNTSAAVADNPWSHPLWPTSGPPVLRGTVIAQRRRRIDVDGTTFGGGGAALPVYKRSDFDRLAQTGANLVVMSFPEFWSVGPPWKRDAQMADLLDRQLESAKAAGLYVVLAMRSGPGRSDFIFHRDAQGIWFPATLIIDSVWREADAQAAWAEMCADAARLVKGRSEVAGLNIMVEPEPNVGGLNLHGQPLGAWDPEAYVAEVSERSDWRRFSGEIARKVRGVARNLPILISPPAFARTEFLAVMGAPAVNGVVWCVHDYEPREFTHHPEDSAGLIRFSESGEGAFTDRLDAVMTGDAPIFLGEFGASRWARGVDAYYDARIAACEARGVAWAAFRWPTQDAAYEASDAMFDVTRGGRDTAPAVVTLQKAWARNSRRPGGALLRGRS